MLKFVASLQVSWWFSQWFSRRAVFGTTMLTWHASYCLIDTIQIIFTDVSLYNVVGLFRRMIQKISFQIKSYPTYKFLTDVQISLAWKTSSNIIVNSWTWMFSNIMLKNQNNSLDNLSLKVRATMEFFIMRLYQFIYSSKTSFPHTITLNFGNFL